MRFLYTCKQAWLVSLFTITLIGGSQIAISQDLDKIYVEQADINFEIGDYSGALEMYLLAIEQNPENVRANFMAGRCYLRTTSYKSNSVDYFKAAYQLDSEVDPKVLYYIGEGFRYGNKFDKAISNYRQFIDDIKTNKKKYKKLEPENLIRRAERKIYECKNAEEFLANPVNVELTNLGMVINSEYEEYAPVVSSDEKILIFTSRRKGTTGGLNDIDNKPFEDIYISYKENGEWSKPENMGDKINTATHDASIGLSPDGKQLFIYKTENGGDIFVCKFNDESWTRPKSISDNINSPYKETSISISKDNKRLFFASNNPQPDNVGGFDIFMCEAEGNDWGKPVNIGKTINTQFDEESPIYDYTTNTLYFCSKGHKGMGGYDLFKTKYDPSTGKWSEPENLGFPINSSDDDIFITLAGDGKRAYYSSHKEGGNGLNDIYVIEFREDEPEELSAPVTLHVTVVDQDKNPIPADIQIVEKGPSTEIVNQSVSSGEIKYTFEPIETKKYSIYVESEGYQYRSVDVEIPSGELEPLTVSREIVMRKPEVNKVTILRNIYFDFDQHTLRPESFNELEKLKGLLQKNPNMEIKIAGHTDAIGPHDYNVELSEQRAQAVVDYLKDHGISSDRLTMVGHGETRPLASNDDELEGRELNRRTEFIILKN